MSVIKRIDWVSYFEFLLYLVTAGLVVIGVFLTIVLVGKNLM